MRTNTEFFKLIDPIGQSLIFILFAYSIDGNISYQLVFLFLVAWQLLSWAINFFIKTVKLKKTERLLYILSILLYAPAYYYVQHHFQEKFIIVRNPDDLTRFPVHEIILIVIGLVVCFWYYVICFREVKVLFKDKN